MEYIQRIKRLLAHKAMTQGDLGERVGLKRAAMSRILSGKQEPKLSEAYELARELGVTLNDLVGDDPEVDSPTGQLVRVSQDDLCLLKVAHTLGAGTPGERRHASTAVIGVDHPARCITRLSAPNEIAARVVSVLPDVWASVHTDRIVRNRRTWYLLEP